MGSQSTAKTLFLLASMGGWLLVGAALMYLFPLMANALVRSELTGLWVENLTRWGYRPGVGALVGGLALALTVAGNVIWYRQFDSKL